MEISDDDAPPMECFFFSLFLLSCEMEKRLENREFTKFCCLD